MKVQVLTIPGCVGCEDVEKMLDRLDIKYEVIDVSAKPELAKKYNLIAAPGIVIDGKLVFTGVPSEDELKRALKIED